MYTARIRGFRNPVTVLYPGEYAASQEDVVLYTVLGSCVGVVLFDPRTGTGGLNHFMLPGPVESGDPILSSNAKYGMYAMELLINEMMKKGVRKADLQAKVFGAASVLDFPARTGANRIPAGNIEFAFSYLEREGIPVAARDVGGKEARRIFLYTRTGRVMLKRVPVTRKSVLWRQESEYLEALRRKGHGPIRMFGRGEEKSPGSDTGA